MVSEGSTVVLLVGSTVELTEGGGEGDCVDRLGGLVVDAMVVARGRSEVVSARGDWVGTIVGFV